MITAIPRSLITAVEIITTEVKKRLTTDNLYDCKYIKVNGGHESNTRPNCIYIDRLTIKAIQTQNKHNKSKNICVLSFFQRNYCDCFFLPFFQYMHL